MKIEDIKGLEDFLNWKREDIILQVMKDYEFYEREEFIQNNIE